MTDIVRRLVSGNKARFKDEELDLELDLAYITDRVIVMGYPSKGIEGFYRNRREDAKKFLDYRHGDNYWVFNLCPVRENSYPAEVFGGRVSRYPFPDHHAPPLVFLPLIAREMRAWLEGSSKRVAVLHCKAGKSRSGLMACTYLLTLNEAPEPSTVGLSRVAAAAAETTGLSAQQVRDLMPRDLRPTPSAEYKANAVPRSSEDLIQSTFSKRERRISVDRIIPSAMKDTSWHISKPNSLDHVVNLHTMGRMKRSWIESQKAKPGIGIPSRQRWLYYWSRLLARQGPPGLWSLNTAESKPAPKVRLTHIKLKMKELSGVKANIIKAASVVIDKTGKGKPREGVRSRGDGQIWLSLARYDDEMVEILEHWERHTRSEQGDLGRRKEWPQLRAGENPNIFADARLDKGKMVRIFARLGTIGNDAVLKEETEMEGKTALYTLRPLTSERWDALRTGIEKDGDQLHIQDTPVDAEEASIHDITNDLRSIDGVVLDANREVRVKLYMGQVYMGWFWFIPTFHMAHPRAIAKSSSVLKLAREELDFPIGVGPHIIDLEVSMEWCHEEADVIRPPRENDSVESQESRDIPSSSATTLVHSAASTGRLDPGPGYQLKSEEGRNNSRPQLHLLTIENPGRTSSRSPSPSTANRTAASSIHRSPSVFSWTSVLSLPESNNDSLSSVDSEIVDDLLEHIRIGETDFALPTF